MFSGYPKAPIIIPAVFKTTDALIPRVDIIAANTFVLKLDACLDYPLWCRS